MKMDDMNEYLEDHGFKVDRKYDSKTGYYTFDICKDSMHFSGDFKYLDPSSPLLLHARQRKFLDNLISEYKEHVNYITGGDTYVLEQIKKIKPCKCGGVPEVTIENNISNPYDAKTIKCPKCGKQKSYTISSLEALIEEWNKDNETVEYWRKPNPVQYGMFYNYGRTRIDPFEIERVIFNDPATIVFWKDGTKTVVKAVDEPFDEEKGLAMAIAKKAYGNKGNYFNIFKKFLIERYVEEENENDDPFEAFAEAMGKLAKMSNKKKGDN